MTSKAAPKAKADKKAKDKTAKKPGPRLVVATMTPGIGHNSGEKHPEAIKLMDELMAFDKQKKSIAKAEGDIRNRLKTEFGVLSSSVQREKALRKLDPDVRVQVENNHEDFKKMLGYQPQLDFTGATPTAASAAAQPSEAELKQGQQEGYTVEESDEQEHGQEGADPLEIPANLRRAAPGVITREG